MAKRYHVVKTGKYVESQESANAARLLGSCLFLTPAEEARIDAELGMSRPSVSIPNDDESDLDLVDVEPTDEELQAIEAEGY